MKLLTTIILILAVASIKAAPMPAQTRDGIDRKATSSIATRIDKEKGVVISTTNRRFTFTRVYPDNVPESQIRTLVILEEFRSERILEAEGQQGSVTAQAWIGNNASPNEKLWSIDQEGDEAAVDGRFYKVTKHGCCGAEDTYVFFNIMTGVKAFTSTGPLFQIDVPNTHSNALKRYVAFRSDMASIPFPESKDTEKLAGVLEYGSESKVLARVSIRFVGERQDMGTPKIATMYRQKLMDTSPLELWGADKKNDPSSLSGFSIVLSYNRSIRIIIPVSNDAPDVTRARTHPMFALSSDRTGQK
jgi:hypothetical protein